MMSGAANLYKPKKPIVQISHDLTNIDESFETAAQAMLAGVDWLETGTRSFWLSDCMARVL